MIASPTSRTCATNSSTRELDAEARGSTRACRACRRCGRARGRSSSRPARRRRRRSGRPRSSSCPRRRRSSACRRPCGRAPRRGRASRRSRIIASVSAYVSARVQAAEVDGHAERGQLVVRDLAARVAEDSSASSSAASSSPFRLRSISSAGRITVRRDEDDAARGGRAAGSSYGARLDRAPDELERGDVASHGARGRGT